MLASTNSLGLWGSCNSRASDLVDAALGPFSSKLSQQKIKERLGTTEGARVGYQNDVEKETQVIEADRCRPHKAHHGPDSLLQPPILQASNVKERSADQMREGGTADACKATLSKDRALSLQTELLTAFTTPAFQRKLYELSRLHNTPRHGETVEYRRAMRKIVRSAQLPILSRYGFQPSEEGVIEMQQAFREFDEDAEIYVNSEAIQEALLSPSSPASVPQEPLEEEYAFGEARKPCNKGEVLRFLRALLINYSEPKFQYCLEELKAVEANQDQSLEAEGFYQLPGRDELAFEVQKEVLPHYGFEASREGVKDMILHCSEYLKDPEVSSLFDAINTKLGMSHAACRRFHKFASSLTNGSQLSCLKGADVWHKCLTQPLGAYRSGLVLTPIA